MNAHRSIPVRLPSPLYDEDEEWQELRDSIFENEFHEWVRDGIRGTREGDWNPREDTDFDDWLALMSQPHMIDCERYRAALSPMDGAIESFNALARRRAGRR